MKLLKGLKTVAVSTAVGAASFAGMANAAIDTTGVTAALTDAGTAIAVVGSAVVIVIVGTKVFKWLARAL